MTRDPSARVEELYAQHGRMVLAVCRGLLRDRIEADDALQQTFLSAQRALANGSTPREPGPWLATIARNECLARIRARAVGPVPTDGEPDAVTPDAHAAAVSREQVAELRDALAELPPQQREAILLREVRGLSYDEVAASLAVSTSAVESLLFRARRRLQVRLREAVTVLSPVGWLGPLRDLAQRAVGTGLGAPAVAKVVAVGVGAVALAGGVTAIPQLERLGRAPASASTRTTTTDAAPSATPSSAASAPAQVGPAFSPLQSGSAIWQAYTLPITTRASVSTTERERGDGAGAGSGTGGEAETETETGKPGTATAGQPSSEQGDGSSTSSSPPSSSERGDGQSAPSSPPPSSEQGDGQSTSSPQSSPPRTSEGESSASSGTGGDTQTATTSTTPSSTGETTTTAPTTTETTPTSTAPAAGGDSGSSQTGSDGGGDGSGDGGDG